MLLTRIPAASLRNAEGEGADRVRERSLRINEIFLSLQGESTRAGLPTVFVRLTGCPLRCGYCDTAYAFHEGRTQRIGEVLERVAALGTPRVCVTGGEPLAQRNCLDLLTLFCDAGYSVSLETSGALDISEVDARVSRIVDIKTPGSGECEKNLWANLAMLNDRDEVKFVLTGREDYEWAKACVRERALAGRCTVLFSPSYGQVDPADLARWILDDRLAVRFQMQLHKVLWGEKRGV